MRRSISAILLLVAGCSAPPPRAGVEVPGGIQMYEGAAVPNQVTLTTFDRWIRVTRIDGFAPNRTEDDTYVPSAIRMFQRERPRTVFLLPGKHVIGIYWRQQGYQAVTSTVWFDGEAGGSYRVRSAREGMQIRFWIEDRRTGQPVGGVSTPNATTKGDD